ncbi:MAG: hypothetical protein EAZ65_01800 [Verrucomicrobia bacterium]|nr:MAG: hypothetical protein EAZ84_11030 [Verrucomicrobiota bacterium]TAE89069.1 MAG: hypothetical protein EAZ82_00100 [Verrucomicrobiota bacterium]TAF28059.1 MAG: hypothetical protein EAZ71_01805 [Verrucomicrobiota bacterium]TAF42906.1 MAG: hypothetical protein EAZ65_01800 [Verrucomicrobiota bacterium]
MRQALSIYSLLLCFLAPLSAATLELHHSQAELRGPITLLIKNVLGFRPDGVRNTLAWNLRLTEQHGIKRLHFGDVTASLVCAPRATPDAPGEITVESDRPFTLALRRNGTSRSFAVKSGTSHLQF